MEIQFDDGVAFDVDGPYRVEQRSDGYYVVGQRMLLPVASREEGEMWIALMKIVESKTAAKED